MGCDAHEPCPFKVGDKVHWTGGSGGYVPGCRVYEIVHLYTASDHWHALVKHKGHTGSECSTMLVSELVLDDEQHKCRNYQPIPCCCSHCHQGCPNCQPPECNTGCPHHCTRPCCYNLPNNIHYKRFRH